MAHDAEARRARQHQHHPAAGQVPRAQSAGRRLAIHPPELALKPNLHRLRKRRRSLLRCMKQACAAAMDHHVHRVAQLGAQVLISESWYYLYHNGPRYSAASRSRWIGRIASHGTPAEKWITMGRSADTIEPRWLLWAREIQAFSPNRTGLHTQPVRSTAV